MGANDLGIYHGGDAIWVGSLLLQQGGESCLARILHFFSVHTHFLRRFLSFRRTTAGLAGAAQAANHDGHAIESRFDV